MPFTKEELEEMARADAEIEENFRMTSADIRASRYIDLMNRGPNAEKKAETDRRRANQYYWAHRDQVLEKIRKKRKEDPEKVRAYYRERYRLNRDHIRAQQNEYARQRRRRQKEAAAAEKLLSGHTLPLS